VRLRGLVIDAWSWISYKPAIAGPNGPAHRAFPETYSLWVPELGRGRLAAYKPLAAYDSKCGASPTGPGTTPRISAAILNPRDRGPEQRRRRVLPRRVKHTLSKFAYSNNRNDEPLRRATIAITITPRPST
jgi:hypothetical protein